MDQNTLKHALKSALYRCGYDVRRVDRVRPNIADGELYVPCLSPWLSRDFTELYERMKPHTLVTVDRCYVLHTLAMQARALDGEFVECGVYKGGTAMLLSAIAPVHLFDTFEGMPVTDGARDFHVAGNLRDTSAEAVQARVPNGIVHKGLIPDTFVALPERIAFAHIDVDIYLSIKHCCEGIYPRMARGGFIVFDDYGFPSCPGARQAVDEFFSDKQERPLVLHTGQAVAFIR